MIYTLPHVFSSVTSISKYMENTARVYWVRNMQIQEKQGSREWRVIKQVQQKKVMECWKCSSSTQDLLKVKLLNCIFSPQTLTSYVLLFLSGPMALSSVVIMTVSWSIYYNNNVKAIIIQVVVNGLRSLFGQSH